MNNSCRNMPMKLSYWPRNQRLVRHMERQHIKCWVMSLSVTLSCVGEAVWKVIPHIWGGPFSEQRKIYG